MMCVHGEGRQYAPTFLHCPSLVLVRINLSSLVLVRLVRGGRVDARVAHGLQHVGRLVGDEAHVDAARVGEGGLVDGHGHVVLEADLRLVVAAPSAGLLGGVG